MLPVQAVAMAGVVSKADVCRSGNVIFRTSSGRYVTAQYLSGHPVKEGEKVSGNLKAYGIQVITKTNGQRGKFYILDIKTSRLDAIQALCGDRLLR